MRIASGLTDTEQQHRLRDNTSAYDRYLIRPRVVRNIENLDPSTTLFGSKISFPFAISPTAMQQMAHTEGEVGTSRAAAAAGIPMALSNYSTMPLEDVIAQSSGNPYMMQISMLKNKAATIRLIKRAEGRRWSSVQEDRPQRADMFFLFMMQPLDSKHSS